MKVTELSDSGADIAYVTPSHQYPTGIIMPIGRRMELLKWAKEEPDRYVIEDDYDSEFRYKGKPIPALQGYDRDGKVIYLGTFSKSICTGNPYEAIWCCRKNCRNAMNGNIVL